MNTNSRHLSIRLLLSITLLGAIAALCPAPTAAGTLNTSVIGMFPKETGELAYADMKAARQFPWFPALRDQLLPSRFRDFEKFLTSSGTDPNTQVEEVAWATLNGSELGDQIVGVALGAFNPDTAEAKFKKQKLPMVESHSYKLYAFGSGSGDGDILFVFLDSSTAAFGNRKALEKLLDVRAGGSESLLTNDLMFPLIGEVNGKSTVWAILDKRFTNLGMTQLLPQADQFPDAAKIIARLHAMVISVDASTDISTHFQAVCDSPADANVLAAALQAGIMYRRYQESQGDPALAKALESVRVNPSGDRLKVDAPVSQAQLSDLIRSHAFAASGSK
jgi:hypothetical protein